VSVTTGVTTLDRTVHKTNEWIGAVADELHTEDRQMAYRVFRAGLHALRDRLIPDEAVDLGAQLPMLVRGMYYEGWRPNATPSDDDRQAFLERVEEGLRDLPAVPDPERWVRAVFAVLSARIDAGEIADVVHVLPRDLKELWPHEPTKT